MGDDIMQETELSFEKDVMPGIEEYFPKKDDYTTERCRIMKNIVLGIISIYRNEPAEWVDYRHIVDFIGENDENLYGKYYGRDHPHPGKTLNRNVGQNLHSTIPHLKFVEKDGLKSRYRFNPGYEGMIDEIKEYVNDIECVEDA